MTIQEHVDITTYTTFRLGAIARYFTVALTKEDIAEAYQFAREHHLSVIILGGGSNIIVREKELEALVLKIEIKGFSIVEEDRRNAIIEVGAGEVWDDIVAKTVARELSGIEAMSFIPGTVGATPIQNVGAYGQEVKDTLVSVLAYDITNNLWKTFTNAECQFSYRDSFFKREGKGNFVIVSATLKLSKEKANVPEYPGVKKYFEEKGIIDPTLAQIREAIIAIRKIKLPDPKEIASVGSFFKNPSVTKSEYEILKEKYPTIVAFLLPDGNYKIGAGWLIDTLGLKGKEFGNLLLYPNNALVIVNKGGATYEQLRNVVLDIQQKVKETFGIALEQEPVEI